MKDAEMKRIGSWIADILEAPADLNLRKKVRSEIEEMTRAFPLYADL
jgi:glycine/serine hydroxymethyltransferase